MWAAYSTSAPGKALSSYISAQRKSVVILPCGTRSGAEMATRYAKGMQKLNEEFVSESIIGSLFYGCLVEETRVGPYAAVLPTIGTVLLSEASNSLCSTRAIRRLKDII